MSDTASHVCGHRWAASRPEVETLPVNHVCNVLLEDHGYTALGSQPVPIHVCSCGATALGAVSTPTPQPPPPLP